MANLPSLETQARVVSDAAQNFVEHYYESLNKRQSLAPYYASASPHLTSASVKPDISINGRVVESPAAFEALLDAQGPHVYYTVASYDAHPVNPSYTLGCPEALLPPSSASASTSVADGGDAGRGRTVRSIRDGDRVSFAVQVSGTVRYGKAGDAPAKSGSSNSTAAATGGGGDDAAAAEGAPVEKGFTEAWLLVPHWEALGRNAPRGLKRWVVISQNFRAF